MVNTNQLLLDSYLYTLNSNDDYYLKEEVILEGLDFNKIRSSFDKNLITLQKYLKDHGLSISYLKQESKKISKFAEKAHASGMSPKQAANVATNKFIDPLYKKVLIALKVREEGDKSELSKKEKLAKSISLFAIVFLCNSFVMSFLASCIVPSMGLELGRRVAYNVSTILITPFIEELSKRYAIKQDYPWTYAWTFYALEGIYYTFQYVMGGKFIAQQIIVRFVGGLVHFFWMAIQKLFDEMGVEYNKEWISWLGFVIAFLLHMFSNFVAVSRSESG